MVPAETGADILAFSVCLGVWATELGRLLTRLGAKLFLSSNHNLLISGEVAYRLSTNHSGRPTWDALLLTLEGC